MQPYLDSIANADLVSRIGYVRQLAGLSIESHGPESIVGEVCELRPRRGRALRAEVVGFRDGRVTLMPYGHVHGIGPGCEVVATGHLPEVGVGEALLGRVIDAFGEPLDGGLRPATRALQPLKAAPLNPMARPPIREAMECGVRAIDTMLTLGRGQRVGIFAGSGVGKSTLLGMVSRHSTADVNVIALIGERGREVREFIDRHLGATGLARSVVVVATSDQPALARARAAYAATAIAEWFRDQGRHVLLTMDSVTRFAMAKREIGLTAGEPPTSRGYTPSVFAELPELCERCGTAESGAITALFTVLVEGDDFNEPISDLLRATLDGHIVLTRQLAQQGHYPAIDVLQSASRLFSELVPKPRRELVYQAFEAMSLYQRNQQMIDIGAYRAGSNPEIDAAIRLAPGVSRFLRQHEDERIGGGQAMAALEALVVKERS
ncbi:FliI/YscN family ATPase [Aquabacterium humicola]|uniref:FliI/YscN family ATPase n=1 Tax=Aquabacterium humicola TaxID=3237377 RepID=UPI002543BBD5|nr:FliI/YscN family ATPase [Rubrivivax pictus]